MAPDLMTTLANNNEEAQRLPRPSALPTLLPISMAIVSLVTLALLVQTTGVTTAGYDVRRLEQERDDWEHANYQLESTVAQLQSLERIDKEAKTKLKMVPATEFLFVSVRGIPAATSNPAAPPSHLKKTNVQREDEGWSQQFLDWLGSVLGPR